MNKKLSTLVVSAMMLATSFGASAYVTVTNGGKYFLKTVVEQNSKDTAEYVSVSADGKRLVFVRADKFETYDRFKRDSATWEVSYANGVTGEPEYSFKNVGISKELSLSVAKGNLFADGINKFIEDNGMLVNMSNTPDSIIIAKAITLTDKSKLGVNVQFKYAQILEQEQKAGNVEGPVAMTVMSDMKDTVNYRPITVSNGDSLKKAKTIVKTIDAAFAKYGIARADNPSKNYIAWADSVDALTSWKDAETYEGSGKYDTIHAPQDSAKFGFYAKYGDVLKVSKHGVSLCKDSVIYGVIEGTNETTLMMNDDKGGYKYAMGTVFIDTTWIKNGTKKYCDLKFELDAAASGESSYDKSYNIGGDSINISDGIGDSLIKKNDPAYLNDFALNFLKKGQDADKVSIQFDFVKDNAAPIAAAENNQLDGANLRFVVKNLLIDTASGKSGFTKQTIDTAAFKSVTMIQNVGEGEDFGKYLYVSDEAYDETKGTTNFKLKWVKLRDLSKSMKITGAVDGITYNNIYETVNGKDTVLPHAGSAIFNIKFNGTDSTFVIYPRFVYKDKVAAIADSTGNGYTIIDNKDNATAPAVGDKDTYYYQLSLKKLGSDAYLTLVNTNAGETAYKIYLQADKVTSRYTKATTESDVYFIQFVSDLAKNKADNGKYYTANGLANLSAFDANNHAENQWALKSENDRVTIVNRETNKALEINGTAIEDVVLYKGSALKADFDTYVTLPVDGGDTLKLTPVDALYKNNAELGKFVCDTTFNPYSKYTFSYYNGLDNSKKLFFGKDSIMCVDAEGNSAEFALVSDFEEYGADAIDGKSVKLTKYTYKMFTELGKDTAYVTLKNGKYAITKNAKNAVKFDLQEMEVEGDTVNTWYTFVESDRSGKASVDDNTLQLFKEELSEVRTSMFTFSSTETYDIYRRLGSTIEDGIAKNDTAYVAFFKANEPNRYLYENSQNIVAGTGTPDGIGYLGMYNTGDMTRNASIFVDPACVADTVVMPTYMMAVDVTAATDTLSGRYLVSLSDSTRTAAKYNGYTRLAFVNAKHIGDSLIIVRDTAKTAKAVKADTIALTKDLNKATFAYELTSKIDNNNADADFYIKNVDGYVWVNNGVPVLVDKKEKAVIFNVEKTDVVPTANESISAEGVKVIAGEGFVTVKGAEGKKVVIANILGQTIANTVVTSSEAQIAAPAGVVVVSVEGEKAQKAIVK
jgi:hypothetical protein